jgi:iron complex outermembrane receptor protein
MTKTGSNRRVKNRATLGDRDMNVRRTLALTTGLTAILAASMPMAAQAHALSQVSADAVIPAANDRAVSRSALRAQRAAERRRLKAVRQAATSGGDTATYKGAEGNDVVVVGIRASLKTARDRKRNSKQIVDSVDAEDAGKLPDNNVPEALARVSGVQIDRAHGEGQNVTIRGLGDVQTTINGFEAASPGSRALNLADIPAELLKSVQVYKTRSADQIEGGIAGTVNVELRRPLDLKKGLTVAGSFRETFSDIGNTKSPYASLLLADRFDTPIGEMGFLLNGSYTKNNYNENYVQAESPLPIGIYDSPVFNATPANQQNIIIPYAVTYGVESGSIKRPSLNASWQWKANEHLDFVVEGSYFGARETNYSDYLKVETNNDTGAYSNLVANPDGTIRSLTYSTPSTAGLPGGPLSLYNKRKTDGYTSNFETHWHNEDVQINFGTQYNWSKTETYFVQQQFHFPVGTALNVDFNSPNVPGGGPYLTFPGADLSNPANYKLFQVHDQNGTNADTLFASKLDFTVKTTDDGLLRSVQFGARFTKRTAGYTYGYRDAFFSNVNTGPTLGTVGNATGIGSVTTTPDITGAGSIPTWYHFDDAQYYDKFSAVRNYVIANGADLGGADWTKDRPGSTDPGQGFRETERTFAAYAMGNYALKAAGIPIDGTFGLRYINTWGTAASTQYSYQLGANGKILTDANGAIIRNLVTTASASKGNYIDLLPSATAILHFSKKLQLRLSYTHNVQRPDFYSLRNFRELRDAIASPTGTVYAGNPNLKPVQENNYDASLEYYFGAGGLLSLGTFLKNQTGFIYTTRSAEYVPEVNAVHPVEQPRNAGPGKTFGLEAQANTFFDFLPGFAKHFGVNANFTYIPVATLDLAGDIPDVPHGRDAPYTSKYSGNVALLYDTPVLSARLAYNYRSSYKTYPDYVNPGYSVYSADTSRLDAAINVTPVKFMTLSVEGTNLLHNNIRNYFGAYQALPVGARQQARVIQAGARFRF